MLMSTPSPTTESPPTVGPRKHIYFDPDLLDALEADAADNGRSLSGTVRYHLRRALGMAA